MKRKHLRDKSKRTAAKPFVWGPNGEFPYVNPQTRKQRKRAKMLVRRYAKVVNKLADQILYAIQPKDRKWFELVEHPLLREQDIVFTLERDLFTFGTAGYEINHSGVVRALTDDQWADIFDGGNFFRTQK